MTTSIFDKLRKISNYEPSGPGEFVKVEIEDLRALIADHDEAVIVFPEQCDRECMVTTYKGHGRMPIRHSAFCPLLAKAGGK